jgi:hypothetical protein
MVSLDGGFWTYPTERKGRKKRDKEKGGTRFPVPPKSKTKAASV